jgi:hypothetical protein
VGRKSSDDDVRERLDEVEAQLRTGVWTGKVQRRLAEKWNVQRRQVQHDAAKVRKLWSENLGKADRQAEAARLLEEVRALRTASAARGLTAGDASMVRVAYRLLDLEANLLGLKGPIDVRVSVAEADPLADARAVLEVLPEVAGMLGLDAEGIIDVAFEEVA